MGGRRSGLAAVDEYIQMAVNRNLRKRRLVLLEFLIDMAVHHLYLLNAVRKRLRPRNGENWYDMYCELFAIDGRTQIERIFDSTSTFFRAKAEESGEAGAFEMLSEQYKEAKEIIIESGRVDTSRLKKHELTDNV